MRASLPCGAVALALVLIGAMVGASGLRAPQKPDDLARARVDLARRIYGQTEEQLKNLPAVGAEGDRLSQTFAELALWSRRWMEAEHDLDGARASRVTALEAHLKRLKSWEDVGVELIRGEASSLTQLALDKLSYDRLGAEYELSRLKIGD
ncbi:hypothetical protein [Paludisphaera soli]|uniref:hypothetical protein n=1 Tax=Paludisphaera soli TaxID=2712865 RepID=UPI0013ED4F8E|nr:hypothetical protein [Paludisphaera soli]